MFNCVGKIPSYCKEINDCFHLKTHDSDPNWRHLIKWSNKYCRSDLWPEVISRGPLQPTWPFFYWSYRSQSPSPKILWSQTNNTKSAGIKDKLHVYSILQGISSSSVAVSLPWDKKRYLETLSMVNLFNLYWTFPSAFNKCKKRKSFSKIKIYCSWKETKQPVIFHFSFSHHILFLQQKTSCPPFPAITKNLNSLFVHTNNQGILCIYTQSVWAAFPTCIFVLFLVIPVQQVKFLGKG